MDNKIFSQPSTPVSVLCCPKVLQSCTTLHSVHGILPARTGLLPCLPPGDLPDPGIELESLTSSALAGQFFTTNVI